MIPSLGSGNLLERLTELEKPVYLLAYWLIIQGYDLGTARWNRQTEHGMG